jgi:lactam utilization protein B
MVIQQSVKAESDVVIPVLAETICIHGDAPGAAAMAEHIFHHLQLHNIDLQKS